MRAKFRDALPSQYSDASIEDTIDEASREFDDIAGGNVFAALESVPEQVRQAVALLSAAKITLVLYPERSDAAKPMKQGALETMKRYVDVHRKKWHVEDPYDY